MERYIVRYLYMGEVKEKRISQLRLSEFLCYPDVELISVRRLSSRYHQRNTHYKHNKHNKHNTEYTEVNNV